MPAGRNTKSTFQDSMMSTQSQQPTYNKMGSSTSSTSSGSRQSRGDKQLTQDEVKAMIKRLTQPTVATIAATWDFDSQDANLAQLKLEDTHIVLKFKTDTYRRIPKFSNVH
jgi:hypothetical protein